MAQTHDLGRLYVGALRYLAKGQSRFFIERGWTNEVEHPFRRGTCVVVRLPFSTLAFVVGLWGQPGEERDRLSSAIGLIEYGPLSDATRDFFGSAPTAEAWSPDSSTTGVITF